MGSKIKVLKQIFIHVQLLSAPLLYFYLWLKISNHFILQTWNKSVFISEQNILAL